MINILLTGGSGFIGKNVIEYFKDKNDYKITSPTSSELNCLDYRCVKSYLTNNYFDIVLNFAVYHNRLDTTKDANLILKNNLLIYYNFAKPYWSIGILIPTSLSLTSFISYLLSYSAPEPV